MSVANVKVVKSAMSHLNIGKKRRLAELRKKQAAFGIPEPYRKSLYEIIQENFKMAGRVMYLNRVMYTGEHNFMQSAELAENYERIIEEVNREQSMEPLTGFILHYSRYFCVMIEGCEDMIERHFRILFRRDPIKDHINRMKLLVAYHNCNQRFSDEWLSYSAQPPTLLQVLDPKSDVHQTYKVVLGCVQKLYKLADDLTITKRESIFRGDSQKSQNLLQVPQQRFESVAMDSRLRITQGAHCKVNENRFINCLPEYAVIEFIINSPFVMNIYQYHGLYGNVRDIQYYREKVWPTGCDYVPLDVFETPADPVIEFPAHLLPDKPPS